MSPSTQRIYLTALELTKSWWIYVPTLEGAKAALSRFYHEVVLQHPYISAAVLLLWGFYPLVAFQFVWFFLWVIPKSIILGFLSCLGFERQGVRSDSIASRYQSRRYGGYTPANSVFSGAQSYGVISHASAQGEDAPPHPAVRFFRALVRLLCLYAVIVLLLQYSAHK